MWKPGLANGPDLQPIVIPLLMAWRQLREQIATFDKTIRAVVRQSPESRLLMSVPGIGPLTGLVYVSTVEDPRRFGSSRRSAPISVSRRDNINLARSIKAVAYSGVAIVWPARSCMKRQSLSSREYSVRAA